MRLQELLIYRFLNENNITQEKNYNGGLILGISLYGIQW